VYFDLGIMLKYLLIDNLCSAFDACRLILFNYIPNSRKGNM